MLDVGRSVFDIRGLSAGLPRPQVIPFIRSKGGRGNS